MLGARARPAGPRRGPVDRRQRRHDRVAGYLVTLGGLTVALAFALQRLLTNVFAGLSLAVDAPFSRSDLIRLSGEGGEEKLYEVIKRGMRITTVRDITSHETVYLP